MGQHAPKPPSSAHLWVHCGLAPAMIAHYPQEETIETLEGTAAHEYVTGSFLGQVFEAGLDLAENGIVISQEMIDAGEEILTDLRRHQNIFRQIKGQPHIIVESRVSAPDIHVDCWGTPDFFAVDWANCVVYCWDYKYGHRFVEEFRNPQCVAYFSGIMSHVGLDWDRALREEWRFRAVIAQPRCFDPRGSLREWIATAAEMIVEVEKLRTGAALPNDLACTGEHCSDCPGAHACAALRKVAGTAIDISRRSVPENLTPEQMGLEILFLQQAFDRLEARLESLSEQADYLMKNGQNVPFVTFQFGQGREVWTLPDEEIIPIAAALGVSISKPGTITPKQARNLAKDNPDVQEALKAFAHTPNTGKRKLKLMDELQTAKAFRGKVTL